MTKQNDDLNQEFESILEECFNSTVSSLKKGVRDIDYNGIAQRLYNLYIGKNFKHKHADIAIFMTNQKDSGEEQVSMLVAETFKEIEEHINTGEFALQAFVEQSNLEKFRDKIRRLSDHINLECVHLDSFAQKQKIEEDRVYTQNEIDQKIDKQKREINDIRGKIDDTEKRLEKQQNQYITILGIFASIVLTIVGSFIFSTSVLSNMHEVSIYRLAFVISCIAFLFFNMCCMMFSFILRLSGKQINLCLWILVNLVLISAMIFSFSRCFDEKGNLEKVSKQSSSVIFNNDLFFPSMYCFSYQYPCIFTSR